ncbi:MAG: aminotransferase class I/II-fold pyridoxal phosphate-dependent enzyme [Planctomycetota bacterium]
MTTSAPCISNHFLSREPSPIRRAQILFAERADREEVTQINLAIGNVSRPIHPAMLARLHALGSPSSPFAEGVVRYSASVGSEESQRAFLHVIAAAGGCAQNLRALVTDGGSQAMELMVLGVAGPAAERPILLLDPAYTNYVDIARRVAARTVSVRRDQGPDGRFQAPDFGRIAEAIERERPTALVVIPADNPTGQFVSQESLRKLAALCVEHNLWLVSDEAYRQLQYGDEAASSVWRLTEDEVPGVAGRRISIESASKVWNACGLRVGALVTDNEALHRRAVFEYTANLCSNVVGQYVFGALAHVPKGELATWFSEQRAYYQRVMDRVARGLREELPGLIVADPEASLYTVIDVRNIAPAGFSATRFVEACAARGREPIGNTPHTLLVAPMSGHGSRDRGPDPDATGIRGHREGNGPGPKSVRRPVPALRRGSERLLSPEPSNPLTNRPQAAPAGALVEHRLPSGLVLSRIGVDPAAVIQLALAGSDGKRGTVRIADLPGVGPVAIRRYRRGGVLRHLRSDTYPRFERAAAELHLFAHLESKGVPTLRPIAAVGVPAGKRWKLFLITEAVPGARNLASLLGDPAVKASPRARAGLLRAAGAAVRTLLDAGLRHPDLNLMNLLVEEAAALPEPLETWRQAPPRVLIIDLDRAAAEETPLRAQDRGRAIGRLYRSYRKLAVRGELCSRTTDLLRFARGYAGQPNDRDRRRARRNELRTFAERSDRTFFLHRLGYKAGLKTSSKP